MSVFIQTTLSPLAQIRIHMRIIWALLLRELATRYGRDSLGFLWVIGEPLLFAGGVSVMWSIIRPPFEHGIRIVPFVITGYMPMILLRHIMNHGLNCVKANRNLLYHRVITLMHLYIARVLLEIVGVSFAFFVAVLILLPFGIMDVPHSMSLIYMGWFIHAWVAFGLTLIMGAISELVPDFEKFALVISYVMIPMTGAFYMVAWIPYQYRDAVLKIPFIHCVEMIRSGFFGDTVQAYFNPLYPMAWALGFTFTGLILLRFVRSRLDMD